MQERVDLIPQEVAGNVALAADLDHIPVGGGHVAVEPLVRPDG